MSKAGGEVLRSGAELIHVAAERGKGFKRGVELADSIRNLFRQRGTLCGEKCVHALGGVVDLGALRPQFLRVGALGEHESAGLAAFGLQFMDDVAQRYGEIRLVH